MNMKLFPYCSFSSSMVTIYLQTEVEAQHHPPPTALPARQAGLYSSRARGRREDNDYRRQTPLLQQGAE